MRARGDIQPLHVAAYVEALSKARSAPTRRLFDWLVVGQVMPVNPAASVRGSANSVKRGKTPVLAPEETREILDHIDPASPIGLRDRTLIALMAFSFARIGAATTLEIEDVFSRQGRLP